MACFLSLTCYVSHGNRMTPFIAFTATGCHKLDDVAETKLLTNIWVLLKQRQIYEKTIDSIVQKDNFNHYALSLTNNYF